MTVVILNYIGRINRLTLQGRMLSRQVGSPTSTPTRNLRITIRPSIDSTLCECTIPLTCGSFDRRALSVDLNSAEQLMCSCGVFQSCLAHCTDTSRLCLVDPFAAPPSSMSEDPDAITEVLQCKHLQGMTRTECITTRLPEDGTPVLQMVSRDWHLQRPAIFEAVLSPLDSSRARAARAPSPPARTASKSTLTLTCYRSSERSAD